MQSGLHHIHKRKLSHQKLEKYPSKDKNKRLMDRIIYFVAIIGPFLAIPQIWKIWVHQNASGVSVFSWTAFFVGAVLWLVYGIIHKEKPIILTNILWMIMQFSIVVGALVYG